MDKAFSCVNLNRWGVVVQDKRVYMWSAHEITRAAGVNTDCKLYLESECEEVGVPGAFRFAV
jgi:hypothetical protein